MQAPAPRKPTPNSNHMNFQSVYPGGNRVQHVSMQQQQLVQQNNAYYQKPGIMHANQKHQRQNDVQYKLQYYSNHFALRKCDKSHSFFKAKFRKSPFSLT